MNKRMKELSECLAKLNSSLTFYGETFTEEQYKNYLLRRGFTQEEIEQHEKEWEEHVKSLEGDTE